MPFERCMVRTCTCPVVAGLLFEYTCLYTVLTESSNELATVSLAAGQDSDGGRVDVLVVDPGFDKLSNLVEFVLSIGAFDQYRIRAEARRSVLARGFLLLF